mmetsp:Transcript_28991/g.72782  ORF Transcript_28991/g.72782 Transcript_28991/m.72782 type:complete len:110 (-) Transcript_28991:10-339(-)
MGTGTGTGAAGASVKKSSAFASKAGRARVDGSGERSPRLDASGERLPLLERVFSAAPCESVAGESVAPSSPGWVEKGRLRVAIVGFAHQQGGDDAANAAQMLTRGNAST